MCMLCNVHFVTLVFALVGIGTFLYKIGGEFSVSGVVFPLFFNRARRPGFAGFCLSLSFLENVAT